MWSGENKQDADNLHVQHFIKINFDTKFLIVSKSTTNFIPYKKGRKECTNVVPGLHKKVGLDY